MKKYLLILLSCLLAQVAMAQDVIVKINGDELMARVREITTTDIIYLSADTTDTLSYKLAKTEVFMVRFANGTKEVFTENLPAETVAKAPIADPAYMYQKGRQDARSYYNGTGALLGSAASVFLAGPVGPIIIGAVKPRARYNKALPAVSLQDPNYVKGYEKQAHNRKIGKAALGFGLGTGVGVLYLIMSVISPGK
ncbi:hypothetical protein JAO76_10965 [Pontibacter sp. BT310]|uniref:Uncharacterized protein n=1 Tax=Pontibacter populi TaxID=890055 RepID=A0ABS6XEL5_9BACT|nr:MULTISPECIES: hypothetical protein [Pontibacter]MBJ6118717.1 hypothetical protein [Pontibacter sp. BT310]MBR0571146.1 hypothetical protein [Microvirga sp. STS03]MBW3365571.1 hypothetical protein [Pontibacter populi]